MPDFIHWNGSLHNISLALIEFALIEEFLEPIVRLKRGTGVLLGPRTAYSRSKIWDRRDRKGYFQFFDSLLRENSKIRRENSFEKIS